MPRTSRANPGYLPQELSGFVGRRTELGDLRRRLVDARLVTLIGVGGTGKTRLALQAAAQLRRGIPDGVWFVDLTELRESDLVAADVDGADVLAHLVSTTLGLRSQAGSALRALTDQLADRQALIVLDNCEHLLEACAVLATGLLRGCPRLRILATSREPLATTGETIVSVQPLSVPEPSDRASVADLTRYESVELFLARGRQVAPGFGLSDDNRVAVAEICRRVDGLPLAIELAAAQLQALAPQQILDRLSQRFMRSGGAGHTAPERQRTLRACVEWSFGLCATPERTLWERLSVFAGGFELDAVEDVCTDELLPAEDMLDLVAGLLDKSILVRADDGNQARYRMLEVIRDFGQHKLDQRGASDRFRKRHRDWCQRLTAQVRAEWVSERQQAWLLRLARDHANLRAAIEYCLGTVGGAENALRILVHLPVAFWLVRGAFGEGRGWLDRGLGQYDTLSALRARALLINSNLAFTQGETEVGRRLLNEGEDLARHLGDPVELARAAFVRGHGALFAGELPAAVDILERGLGTLARAPQPDPELGIYLLNVLAVAAGLSGDHVRALACLQEIAMVTGFSGAGHSEASALWVRGLVSWLQGDLDQAAEQMVDSLVQAEGLDDRYGVAVRLEMLAWIAASQRRYQRAATLLGAADALWTDLASPIAASRHLVGRHEACRQETRDALGETAFTVAFRHGQTMSFEDALDYARDKCRPPKPRRVAAMSARLTPREQQVAALVTQGLSNREIAATLAISQRTAESHVENILTKLDLANRVRLAVWMAGQSTDAAPASP